MTTLLTSEVAKTLAHGRTLVHAQIRNADGTPLRARVNGKCQTWASRPNEWRLPCKHGLRQCFDITQDNVAYWAVTQY